MAAINRKQVPLCHNHHVQLHRGTINQRDRELFALGCKEFIQGFMKKDSRIKSICFVLLRRIAN
jgi:hypothetical protein